MNIKTKSIVEMVEDVIKSKAVKYENKERNAGYKFIGIELDPEYCKIAEARIGGEQ